MMRILQVNTKDGGGAAIACLRLHDGLLKQGLESDVLVLHKQGNAYSRVHEYWKGMKAGAGRFVQKQKAHYQEEWNNYKIKKRPQGYERYSLSNSSYSIQDHPLYQQADIINLHWVSGFLDYASFFKNNKKPIVWTMHDMAPFSGGYHYLEGFPTSQYQDWIKAEEEKKIKALQGQDLHIVGLSKWLFQLSLNSKAFGSFPHHLIPNGLDTTVFTQRDREYSKSLLNIPKDLPVLLFVSAGLRNKRKGLHLLLEAINQLEDVPLLLLSVGDQTAFDFSAKKKHIQTRQLGMVRDQLTMSIVYSCADYFVIPSIEDNLPNTVVESLCCGTPVIGFPIGGIPDMVEPKKNGVIAEEVSVAALTESIKLSLNTDFSRSAIQEAAAKKYSDQRQANDYVQLYQKIMK